MGSWIGKIGKGGGKVAGGNPKELGSGGHVFGEAPLRVTDLHDGAEGRLENLVAKATAKGGGRFSRGAGECDDSVRPFALE